MAAQPDPFQFDGYDSPNYTPVPDQLLDEHLSLLSGAELKVVLYICRRTFGFKRDSDNISLNQMLHGIVTHDGRRLDSGTGLSKPSLINALKSLIEKNIVIAQQRVSAEKGNEATNYRLNIRIPLGKKNELGESNNFTPLGKESLLGVVKKVDQGVVKKVDQGLGKKSLPTTNSKTTNSSTKDSKTKNSNNNRTANNASLSKDAVVVALIDLGIGKKVAQQLAEQHNESYIREKIDHLEFLLAARPEEVQKPAGWLRKAIEDNYGPPDGYQSPAQRAAEAAQQAQWEEEQRQLEAEADRRFQEEQARRVGETEQKRQAEAERIARLQELYGTSVEEHELWTQVLADLELQVPESGRAQLIGSTLLQVRDGKALVAIRNGFMRDWVKSRLSKKIERVLVQQLGETVALEFTGIQEAEAAILEEQA